MATLKISVNDHVQLSRLVYSNKMPFMQRIKKASTRKGKKILLAQEPKLVEDAKQCFFIQGRKSSDILKGIVKDFYSFKKPNAVMFQRKNDVSPFEDATLLEKLARSKLAALFTFVSHSKKRPNNLVLGRMFDWMVLDMIELGVDKYIGLEGFKVDKISTLIKPCLIFNGPAWEQNLEFIRLKSLLIDMFHWEKAEVIRLQGLEHVLSFTATEDSKIYLRSYKTQLKKSGQRTPRVELIEIGPSIDMTLRRTKLAAEDLMKQACRKPKELKVIKKKNISRDKFGTKHGRIHMGRQDINKLQTRKMKGLKRTPEEKKQRRLDKKNLMKSNSETSMNVD